jgi:hypothetical protein
MWRKELEGSSLRLRQAPVSNGNRTTLELRFGAAPIASSTGTGAEVGNRTPRLLSAIMHFAIPNNRNPELVC